MISVGIFIVCSNNTHLSAAGEKEKKKVSLANTIWARAGKTLALVYLWGLTINLFRIS